MQKQKKQFIAVIVVLVLFIAGYFGLRYYNSSQEEAKEKAAEAETIYVTDVKEKDITTFSYQYNDSTLTFTKTGDEWSCDASPDLKLDKDKISSMLSVLENLKAEEQIEDAGELSEYGFNAPQNVITFTTESGTTTLTVGMNNEVAGGCYLTSDGKDGLFIVDETVPQKFTAAPESMIQEETETEAAETETQPQLEEEDSTTESATEEPGETE